MDAFKGIQRIHYYLNPFIEPGLVLGCGRELISALFLW